MFNPIKNPRFVPSMPMVGQILEGELKKLKTI